MKKLLFFVFAVSCFAISTATAQVNFSFSTSATNVAEGTVLNLIDGQSGSMFVWVDNADVSLGFISGMSLDVTGAGASALVATAFNTENPAGRWQLGPSEGTLGVSPGLLVDDSGAGAFLNGIANGVGPVLHAELQFTANGVGSNTLGMAEGGNLIALTDATGAVAPASLGFGEATVNVAAVPEPTSLFLVGSIVGAAFLRRRRA